MHIRTVAGSGRRSVGSQERAAPVHQRESLESGSVEERERAASVCRRTHETARGTCIGGGIPDRDSLETGARRDGSGPISVQNCPIVLP